MLHVCEQSAGMNNIMQKSNRMSVSLSAIGKPDYTVHTFNILLCIDPGF